MDDKVQAVLDTYHARADEEMPELREPVGSGIEISRFDP